MFGMFGNMTCSQFMTWFWDMWQWHGHVALTWACGFGMDLALSHMNVFGQCDGLAVSCLRNAMRHEHTWDSCRTAFSDSLLHVTCKNPYKPQRWRASRWSRLHGWQHMKLPTILKDKVVEESLVHRTWWPRLTWMGWPWKTLFRMVTAFLALLQFLQPNSYSPEPRLLDMSIVILNQALNSLMFHHQH